MDYILVSIFAYLIGSIPFAYLIIKKHKNIDIRNSGSGNVGAMNTYEVSNSKRLGILVFILDFGKGIFTVFSTTVFFNYDVQIMLFALFFVVLGHCFSIWLHFKGGKGLATAAGGSIIFAPVIPIIWTFIWVIAYRFKREINLSNIIASFLTIIIIIFCGQTLNNLNFFSINNPKIFQVGTTSIMIIILIKHLKNIYALFNK